jgi:hypothetical protein
MFLALHNKNFAHAIRFARMVDKAGLVALARRINNIVLIHAKHITADALVFLKRQYQLFKIIVLLDSFFGHEFTLDS